MAYRPDTILHVKFYWFTYILSMAASELRADRADRNNCRARMSHEAENVHSAPLRKSLSNHGLAPRDLH